MRNIITVNIWTDKNNSNFQEVNIFSNNNF